MDFFPLLYKIYCMRFEKIPKMSYYQRASLLSQRTSKSSLLTAIYPFQRSFYTFLFCSTTSDRNRHVFSLCLRHSFYTSSERMFIVRLCHVHKLCDKFFGTPSCLLNNLYQYLVSKNDAKKSCLCVLSLEMDERADILIKCVNKNRIVRSRGYCKYSYYTRAVVVVEYKLLKSVFY